MPVKQLWVLSIRLWIERIWHTIIDISQTALGSVDWDMDRTYKIHYYSCQSNGCGFCQLIIIILIIIIIIIIIIYFISRG